MKHYDVYIKFTFLILLFQINALAQSTMNYQESFEDFLNPERGWYLFSHSHTRSGCQATDMTPCSLQYKSIEDSDFTQSEYNAHSTIQRIFNLSEFNSNGSVISSEYLNNVQADFDFIRAKGMKALIIFEYTGVHDLDINNNVAQYAHDFPNPNVETILNHIDQLAPILQNNSDIIFVVKAAFIGFFGEWYYSNDDFGIPNNNCAADLGLTAIQWNNRRAVVDKLLDILPTNRMVEVRSLQYKANMYGWNIPNDGLSASEAHNGSKKARIGWHNDGFSASFYETCTPSDNQFASCNRCTGPTNCNPIFQATTPNYNTFCCNFSTSDYYTIRDYHANETQFVPSGAEFSHCDKEEFYDCDFVIEDMERHHISHVSPLNSVIEGTLRDEWQSGGCEDEINRRIGYRLKLNNASATAQIKPGNRMNINISLDNVGFAAPVNQRNVQLVLKNNANPTTLYKVNLCEDPRKWLAGNTHTISATVGIPPDMSQGAYSLFLNLNDPEIQNNPKYSIQLANQNVWDASTGYNDLLIDIQIAATGSSPYSGGQWFTNSNPDLCVIPIIVEDCDTHLNITTTYNSGANIDHEANNTITASNIINSGANVDYDAGNEITLVDGFHAKYGSDFHAFIDGCDGQFLVSGSSDPNTFSTTYFPTNSSDRLDDEVSLRNYPNPFTGTTTIEYTLPQAQEVSLTITNMSGQIIRQLKQGELQEAGIHELQFDAQDLPSGVYMCTLQAGATVQIQKMTLIQ